MNRTLIRGVTAGVLSGGLVAAGAGVSTSMADGAPATAGLAAAVAPTATARFAALPLIKRFVSQQSRPAAAPPSPAAPARAVQPAAQRSQRRRAPSRPVSPKALARTLVRERGWSSDQFGCLDRLWTRESNWRVGAHNDSGAYGIPQALPAHKMASMGADWRSNARTQIRWGLAYIAASYGTPCAALAHSNAYNFY